MERASLCSFFVCALIKWTTDHNAAGTEWNTLVWVMNVNILDNKLMSSTFPVVIHCFFYEVRLQHMDWSASCSWWCAQLALCCCFMSLAMPNPMWSLSHASSRTHIHIQEDIAARQIHHPIICLSFFSFFFRGVGGNITIAHFLSTPTSLFNNWCVRQLLSCLFRWLSSILLTSLHRYLLGSDLYVWET